MTAHDSEDRAAILKRRAALVASALSTLALPLVGGAGSAEAQQPGPAVDPKASEGLGDAEDSCQPEPGEVEPLAVLTAVKQAKALSDEGKHAEAATRFAQVYRWVPATANAVAWMGALEAAGDLDGAEQVGLRHLRCGFDTDRMRDELLRLEKAGGRLRVALVPDGSGRAEVDGKPIDLARLKRGALLLPGSHEVVVDAGRGRSARQTVTVTAQASTEIALMMAEPQVCLSISRPTEQGGFIRLRAGPMPVVAFGPGEEAVVVGGGGLRAAMTIQLTSKAWLDTEVFALFFANQVDRFMMVGTGYDVRYEVLPRYSVGVGLSGGYLGSVAEDEAGRYLVSSPFIGPVITPVSLSLGVAQIETRIPCWFASTVDAGVEAVRVAMVGLLVSATFGGSVVDRKP